MATKRLLRILLSTLLMLGGVHVAQAAEPAARAHPVRPAFPQMSLPDKKSSGQRALDLLGDRLPPVAAWYGKSPEEFRAWLLSDRTIKLDQRGRVFVEEETDQPLPADLTSTPSPGLLDGTLAPLDQTFMLHSRPGAKRTIYLNFRGAQLSNTVWNGSGGTITALPFDIDGVPYSLSTTELQRIQYIWQRVAEDYAPFDVDVTTEPPAGDMITRSGSSDDVFGTVVLVTSRSGVYSCSCGGVAYIGVFDETSDYYKPALVFYDALGSGHEKYVAEAISHEAGHNMGLGHDGYSGGTYYSGQGSGATGWAPIMGSGYSQALVQWSKGEYATATNVQDDFLVMQSNGLPLRADDHGNTAATATLLAGTASGGLTALRAEGVVELASDIDVFGFVSGAGAATFSLAPASRSPNLDALIDLRDGLGTLLASANPPDGTAASLTATLPAAGTYYLSVRGTGKGDPLTTGYTAYGSVGQYVLTGSVPSTAAQPPVAALQATPTRGTAPLNVSLSGTGSYDPDGSIVSYAWAFGDGATGSDPVAVHAYGTPGTYLAQLRVTDNSGLSASTSATITVDSPVLVVKMGVGGIAMGLKIAKSGTRASAVVTIVDADGRVVPGATVAGSWSGIVSGTSSVLTGSGGTAAFSSPLSKKSGTFVFTVTGVTLQGYGYDPSLNVETSDSITR